MGRACSPMKHTKLFVFCLNNVLGFVWGFFVCQKADGLTHHHNYRYVIPKDIVLFLLTFVLRYMALLCCKKKNSQ